MSDLNIGQQSKIEFLEARIEELKAAIRKAIYDYDDICCDFIFDELNEVLGDECIHND